MFPKRVSFVSRESYKEQKRYLPTQEYFNIGHGPNL